VTWLSDQMMTLPRAACGPSRDRPIVPPGGPGRKVVVIGSLAWSLVNFRLDLMRRMIAMGHSVVAVAPDIDETTCSLLEAAGIVCRSVPMDRTGLNPLRDLTSMWALLNLLRDERPDVVLAYTMKPIVYGCLAARLAGVPAIHALFTGLGYAFTEDRPKGRRRAVRALVVQVHRLTLGGITAAFCYNAQERRDIRHFRLIPPQTPLHDLPGSGVDTTRFTPTPVPEGAVRFLFVGRLLRSKGLAVLAEAAALLQAQGRSVLIDVLGPQDSNPDAVDAATLDDWQARGLVRLLGATRDVAPYFRDCSVFVLPTLLREGVPRTILEAMASGRAVITSDAPGCGETIADGVTGLVVPRGDAAALAQAMARFLDDPGLARRLGAAARVQACVQHDVHRINRMLLTHMGLEIPPIGTEALTA
jgi:glycosyltransferase involved in cell wall biosynthesis